MYFNIYNCVTNRKPLNSTIEVVTDIGWINQKQILFVFPIQTIMFVERQKKALRIKRQKQL